MLHVPSFHILLIVNNVFIISTVQFACKAHAYWPCITVPFGNPAVVGWLNPLGPTSVFACTVKLRESQLESHVLLTTRLRSGVVQRPISCEEVALTILRV